eukprot:3684155-Rhodomonas_salina.3
MSATIIARPATERRMTRSVLKMGPDSRISDVRRRATGLGGMNWRAIREEGRDGWREGGREGGSRRGCYLASRRHRGCRARRRGSCRDPLPLTLMMLRPSI